MAKRPGAQSMLEKSLMAASLVWYRGSAPACPASISLGAAGSLSADEVFSPAQLILDRELCGWLTRAVLGADHEVDRLADAFDMIREGVALGSFVGADATLDHFRKVSWFPQHLRREMLATWQAAGSPDAVATATAEAAERIAGASWALPEPRFSQLEDLYREAESALGGR